MISVIIPVFNVEEYLDKCLESILTNTYRDLEVICVNDGSTDRCPEILRKWKERDLRVIIVNQENRGVVRVRNSGLDAATGEYIAFVDSDDWIHPRYFESMLDCMEKTGADMVVCGCRKFEPGEEFEIDPDLKPGYRRLTAQEFYRSYYARHMIWGRLIRRRDAEKLRFPPEVLALEDTLYNLRLISRFRQPNVYETDAELYFYLQRPGSLVRTHTYQRRIEIAEWYVKNGRDPYHQTSGNWGWMLLMEAISTVLDCRYEAILRDDTELTRHANDLLRVMCEDLNGDPRVHIKDKLTRTIMCRFPSLYRLFRLWDDSTMLEHERLVRMSSNKQQELGAGN